MSVACYSVVMRLRLPDPTEKLVLLAFAEHANEDSLTFPSVDLVAAEALCSGRTVQRIIQRFTDVGLLRLHKRASGRGYPTCYRVDPWAIGPVADYDELRNAQRRGSHPEPARAPVAPVDDNPQQELLPVDNSVKGDTLVSPFMPPDESLKGDRSGLKGDRSGLKGDTRVSPEPITYNHNERDKSRPVDNSLASSLDRTHQHQRKPSADPPDTGKLAAPMYQESLEIIDEKARQHAIGPRKKWENEQAWRNIVKVAIGILATQGAEARRLKIDGRRPDESVEQFDRRVTDHAMGSEGMASSLPWEEARQQAIDKK